MNFVGSKGGSGIAQWIISHMPRHAVYIEAFLGTGVILRTKHPAEYNYGIELDPAVIEQYWDWNDPKNSDCFGNGGLINESALTVFPRLQLHQDSLVYADPPYLKAVRSHGDKPYYGCEFGEESEHRALAEVLKSLPGYVMVSGYASRLYDELYFGWSTTSKWTVNRRGHRVQEWLWCNFDLPPATLHDSRFVGGDFRERLRIKRKAGRWSKKFKRMDLPEREAIITALLKAEL